METIIEKSENQKDQKSEITKAPRKGKGKKNSDSVNLESAKINLSKGKKDLLSKEGKINSRKDIYKGTSELGEEEKKKFRGKIRRMLHQFVNQILGKDRSEEERTKSVKAFLKFYKENWKIQNFELESFSQSQNETDKKDYANLLKYVKSILD